MHDKRSSALQRKGDAACDYHTLGQSKQPPEEPLIEPALLFLQKAVSGGWKPRLLLELVRERQECSSAP